MRLRGDEQVELFRSFLCDGKAVKKPAFGESMLPTIPDGAVLEIQPIGSDRIRPGEIAFFVSAQGPTLVHRITKRFKRDGQMYVQAWGDNNHAPDVCVPEHQVLGRVVAFTVGETRKSLHPKGSAFFIFLLRRYSWYYLRNLCVRGRRRAAQFSHYLATLEIGKGRAERR